MRALFDRSYQRMQLVQEACRPHDVHAGSGEHNAELTKTGRGKQ